MRLHHALWHEHPRACWSIFSGSGTKAIMRALAVAVLLSAGSSALAGDIENGDTVASYRLTVDAHGPRMLEVSGSNLVTLKNGQEFLVDLDALEDPDGNHYVLVGDSYQLDEADPIVHEDTPGMSRFRG